jgi:hypothetical protein
MTDPLETPVQMSSDGGGFVPGATFIPDAAAAPEGEKEPGLLDGLFEGGKPVSEAKAIAWLKARTADLDGIAGEGVKADLQMTDREASLVAAGLVEWSQRAAVIGTVLDPPPMVRAGAGMMLYGWRVSRERKFALELEADAAQAVQQLAPEPEQHVRPFDPVDHPGDVT